MVSSPSWTSICYVEFGHLDNMKNIIRYFLWLVVVAGGLLLVSIALPYFSFETDYDFLLAKQDMLQNTLWRIAFYVHLASGTISILIGLLLFMPRLVMPSSNLHKSLGKIYVVAILYFGAPTGLYLGFYAEAGMWASIGFVGMSLAWAIPTLLAVETIRKGEVEEHYKWMVRSLSLTLAGVTLRLMTPIGIHLLEWDYNTNFIVTAYIPWMLNWGIAELVILSKKTHILNIRKSINYESA